MEIVFVDMNEVSLRDKSQRVHALPGVTVTQACLDLTAAFDFIEHNPPKLVLVSEAIAMQPGYEMLVSMCKLLSIKHGTYRDLRAASKETGPMTAQALQQALSALVMTPDGPKPGAGAGLLTGSEGSYGKNVVLIGSSTGGIDALLTILGAFPRNCPPTFVVQHTGASYSAGLMRMLNDRIQPDVVTARDGAVISAGQVVMVSGGDHHLEVSKKMQLQSRLNGAPLHQGHRPAVDNLFFSATSLPRMSSPRF